ncbi:transporter substrate-binding domain-containing protein [Candidatus Nomurabacteria bacterium]|nr:transporter substrate-binding domain-containing protein [Candidatus Nomurabacteria bacterium]
MAKSPFSLIFSLAIFLLGASFAYGASTTILNSEQESWFNRVNRTILVQPQKNYAPFVFTGSGTNNKIKGLSADYIEAIARKVNGSVAYNSALNFSEIITKTQEGDNGGVVLAISPTEDLERFFYFTDSYVDMPAVIVVRKDFNKKSQIISLSDFNNKDVALTKAYPVESYVKTNYPKVNIVSVLDDQAVLQKLLLGEVDAAVMDLASLSYYTSNDVLSYVKAVGRTGFEYKYSFGVPKTNPELLLVLDTGLKALSDSEKQIMFDKWIKIGDVESLASSSEINQEPKTLSAWLIFFGFVILIIATIVIVGMLRKRQYTSILNRKAKNENLSDVKDELKELQNIHKTLKEEMEYVEALEEDIEKKIHKVEE